MIAHARCSFLPKSLRHPRRDGIARSLSSSPLFFASTRTSSPRLWQRNSSSSSTHQRATRILDSNEGGASSAEATTGAASLKKTGAWLSKMVAWYSNKLDTHPLITKGISSGIIAASADLVCQVAFVVTDNNNNVDKQNNGDNDNNNNNNNNSEVAWDKARTARFGFLGAFLVAPCIHFWYRALAARVPGTNTAAVVQRVFIDQFIYTPLFLPVWLTSLWALEGHACIKDFSSVLGRIQETMPTVMVANWTLWIPAQSFNFAMIPLRYQVLYSNVVSLLWNVYLSHSQTSKTPGKVMDELDEVVPT